MGVRAGSADHGHDPEHVLALLSDDYPKVAASYVCVVSQLARLAPMPGVSSSRMANGCRQRYCMTHNPPRARIVGFDNDMCRAAIGLRQIRRSWSYSGLVCPACHLGEHFQ